MLGTERFSRRVTKNSGIATLVEEAMQQIVGTTPIADLIRPRLCLDTRTQALLAMAKPSIPTVSRMVASWIKKVIGRVASCHLLRHTCATHMLEGGADIRYIQQLLGHSKLETTAIYTEVSIKQLQEVHARCHPSAQLPPAPAAATLSV